MASEEWIGLFDAAKKGEKTTPKIFNKSLNDLLAKTQTVINSKYIDEEKRTN